MAGQRIGMGGQVTQKLDSFLKGEATRAIERGSYQQANGFITRSLKKAVELAINGTMRKYPLALERDERRRPIPNAPHLVEMWDFSPASGPVGGALVNRHPKAAMLIVGFDTESVITPRDFLSARKGVPVLMFPKAPSPAHLFTSNAIQLSETVIRPVPASQRSVDVPDTIPYRAIRQAFRQGRRS